MHQTLCEPRTLEGLFKKKPDESLMTLLHLARRESYDIVAPGHRTWASCKGTRMSFSSWSTLRRSSSLRTGWACARRCCAPPASTIAPVSTWRPCLARRKWCLGCSSSGRSMSCCISYNHKRWMGALPCTRLLTSGHATNFGPCNLVQHKNDVTLCNTCTAASTAELRVQRLSSS